MGMISGVFKSIQRIFIYLGLLAEKATENDAMNEAVVERNIRDSKERAGKANYANGQLQTQVILLRDQIKGEERKKIELQSMVDMAVKQNDEANGAIYAEQLADLEADIATNNEQLKSLTDAYKQNTEIIAESIRQCRKMEQDFISLRARVKVSRNMENLANMMKASITELQGMAGGNASEAMQRMREAAAQGQGQVTATMDLAKEMGASIRMQQDARKARGKALFAEYKQKAAAGVQATETNTATANATHTVAKEKLAVAN